ncbi:MAG: MBL fold metallo-hydrolase [Oscillospiraceae bacterium]|jgi:glyoxylase-like metal-dependent hydrolase (beta-lactamase superfamily II)|nr:MBL fold metallo-hydrolase [Oscillospiraceae bacterium]
MRIKISDKITVITTEQGFTYANWIHINDDISALIETGMDRDGLMGLDPERIDLAVNSHHHLDHIRGNAMFSNAALMIHGLEADLIQDAGRHRIANSLDEWRTLMPEDDRSLADDELQAAYGAVDPFPFESGQSVVTVSDGQLLDFGSVKAQVLHTPGHSAGHCCFFFPEENLLYSADVCLTKAGPWYGEHLADPGQMTASIDRLIALAPERMISGHIHALVYDCVPRLREFKSRIISREERIYRSLVACPKDIHRLAEEKLIYRSHGSQYVVFWEKLMLMKHIEKLRERGLVRAESGVFYGVR